MVSPRRKSEGSFLTPHAETDKEGGELISHCRQPSQEELEIDQKTKELASQVAEREKKLSNVLSTDSSEKRMKYMDGLSFGDTSGEVPNTPACIRRNQSQHGLKDSQSRSPAQQQQQDEHDSPAPAEGKDKDDVNKR
jgi:hypothetical protein